MKFIPLEIPENIIQSISENPYGFTDFINIIEVVEKENNLIINYGYNDFIDENSFKRYFIRLDINNTEKTIYSTLNCEIIEKNNDGKNISIPLIPPLFTVDYKFDTMDDPKEEAKGIALFTINLFESPFLNTK